jgi:hypothetical protein
MAALAARRALANTDFFTGNSSLWSDPAAWDNGVAPPPAGDDVNIFANSPNSVLVFDASAPSNNLNSVTIDNPAGVTLSQTSNTFLTNLEYVGYTNAGVVSVSGGTHNVGNGGGSIYLGYTNGSSGTFNLSGTGSVQAADVYVGYAGSGVFNQSGGNHSLGGFLSLGGVPDGTGKAATGTYNLVSGSLSLNTLYVGLAGTGTFSQSNGSTSFGATDAGYLPGASGTVNLGGGSYFNVGDEIYGDGGTATLNSTGGSHLTASLTLGNQSTGVGTANVSGGVLTVDGIAKIGNVGSGTVNHSGGTLAPLDLYLSTQAGSTGIYNLSNGAFLHVTRQVVNGQSFDGNEYMGYASSGIFNQTGGTHLVDVWLYMGRVAGSLGTYNMTGGTLTTPALSVGYLSTGNNVFNESSGSVACKVLLTVGDQANCRGTYNLSGSSTLNVNALYDSWAGLGTFNQTNGAATVQQLFIAHESTAISTYNLFGGSLATSSSEDIGYHGNGTFNQSGGLHTVTGTAVVTIRTFTNATGTYNLSGGTFTAGLVINNGSLNLTGGTATFSSLGGSGTTTLAGATTLTANALSQARLSVSSGASVVLLRSSTPVTNSISQLSLTGGKLDVGNQDLVTLTGGGTIRSYVAAGVLFSSAVAGGGSNNLALGYATSSDTVSSKVSIPAGSTLVKLTLQGDADLSGTVDFNDFLSIQNNYNRPGDWAQGDFNYDGTVDFNDFLILQNDYNRQLGGGSAAPAIAAIENAILVPEPAVPLLLLTLFPLFRSRRSRRHPV